MQTWRDAPSHWRRSFDHFRGWKHLCTLHSLHFKPVIEILHAVPLDIGVHNAQNVSDF